MSGAGGEARAAAATVVDQVLTGGRTLDRALRDIERRLDPAILRNLGYRLLG